MGISLKGQKINLSKSGSGTCSAYLWVWDGILSSHRDSLPDCFLRKILIWMHRA